MCMREVPPRDWIDSSAPFLADPLARLELDDKRLGGFPVVDPADLNAIPWFPSSLSTKRGCAFVMAGGITTLFLPPCRPEMPYRGRGGSGSNALIDSQ